MVATLESRKLRIVDFLADLQDEALVLQIENLLFPHQDWWDLISENEKSSIARGIEDAENGRKTELNIFMNQLRQKHYAYQHHV